jgi:hypothetical protein
MDGDCEACLGMDPACGSSASRILEPLGGHVFDRPPPQHVNMPPQNFLLKFHPTLNEDGMSAT